METKLKRILLIVTLLFSISKVIAQPHLAVIRIYNYPDTARFSLVYDSIKVTLKNVDTTTFVDSSLYIILKNNGTNNFDTIYSSNNVVLLLSSDTIQLSISPYQFSAPLYAAGHDVVIVWPIAGIFVLADTLTDSVFIIDDTGIPNDPTDKRLSLYPNPSKEYLSLKYESSINDVEYVRLMDILGNEINRYIPSQSILPVESLSSGIYFIEIKLKNGTLIRDKFIKE